MDIQIDICKNINEKEWNSVVYNSKHGSIFHTIDWVDLLEKEYGRKILIGAWLNKKLIGVFPCIVGGTEKYTRHIRSFRLGYDHGGPLSIVDNHQVIMGMIHKFEEIAEDIEANKSTITFPVNRNFDSELEGLGFRKSLGLTFIINLKKSFKELWGNLNKHTRRNVRYALKNGLTVRLARNRSEIENYYELFLETANRAGFDPDFRSKTFYYNLWDSLYEKGLIKILFVEFNNEIIAGKICLLFKKMIVAFCTGTLSEYRSYQPSSLLTWHSIEWGTKNGFEYYDLAGANMPQLYKFKKKWGGELNEYNIFTKTYPSLKYKLISSYNRMYKSLKYLKKYVGKRFYKK